MDTLQLLHDLEWYLPQQLSDKEQDEVLEYLNDDPMDTSPQHLASIFDFKQGGNA